jgi:hypothetical protein
MNSSLKVMGGGKEVSSGKTGLPPRLPSVVSSPNCFCVLVKSNPVTTVMGAIVEKSIVIGGLLPVVPAIDSSPANIRVLARSGSGNGVETVFSDLSLTIPTVVIVVVDMFSRTGGLESATSLPEPPPAGFTGGECGGDSSWCSSCSSS